jgi:major vault protein
LPNLDAGRKVNIPGPVSFALWPGQMMRVLQGHHLRSNQYLLVRVYDEEAAKLNWKNAVIKPQKTGRARRRSRASCASRPRPT